MKAMLNTMQSISGSFQLSVSIECMLESIGVTNYVYGNALIGVLLGPMCLMCIMCGLLIAHCTQNHGPKYSLQNRLIIVVMFVTFLFQPSAVKAVLMLFTCRKVGEQSLMFYQMDISCNDPDHALWQWGMGAAGILYAVVLPCFKLWKLCHVRELILAEEEDTLRTCNRMPLLTKALSLTSCLCFPLQMGSPSTATRRSITTGNFA